MKLSSNCNESQYTKFIKIDPFVKITLLYLSNFKVTKNYSYANRGIIKHLSLSCIMTSRTHYYDVTYH